jgi:hypothetical protein
MNDFVDQQNPQIGSHMSRCSKIKEGVFTMLSIVHQTRRATAKRCKDDFSNLA